jgi:hypothetical protein
MIEKEFSLRCLDLCADAYGGEYGKPDLSWLTGPRTAFSYTKRKLLVLKTRVEGFFARDGKTLYLVFEGTDGFVDWLYDLYFRHRVKKLPNGAEEEIHAGFRDQWGIADNGILAAITAQIGDIDTLVITGHSLGGALSCIASRYIAEMFPDLKVIRRTFGSPIPGNKVFRDNLARLVPDAVDYQNSIDKSVDPVTVVPPEWAGYAQIPRFELSGNRVDHWWKSIFFKCIGDTDAHYPSSYRSGLNKIA